MFGDERVHTPVAFSLPERAINLPSYHDMTDADQRRVIEVVRTLCQKGIAVKVYLLGAANPEAVRMICTRQTSHAGRASLRFSTMIRPSTAHCFTACR